VQKARDVLGWEAQIEVAEGIQRTIEWLRTRL
jgi:nucleoside-diphosphate-sugar epimerase